MNRLSTALILLIAIALSLATPTTSYAQDAKPKVVPNEVLIEFNDSITTVEKLPQFQEMVTALGITNFESLIGSDTNALQHVLQNTHLAHFDDATLARVLTVLNSLPFVEAAQPNYLYYQTATPNDPLYSQQWAHIRTKAPAGWDITTGNNNVIVAVLDSGVNYNHEDLRDNMWTGQVDGQTVYGWDYYENDSDPSDPIGHGTQVAGIIGAVGNNGTGIAGAAWNVQLMAVRISGEENTGGATNPDVIAATSQRIMQGASFAADNGAQVINLSSGFFDTACNPAVGLAGNPLERQFIQQLVQQDGVLLVSAAGNDGGSANCFTPTFYDEILTVTATDNADRAASYSNYGPTAWKNTKIIAAPGGGRVCNTSTCPLTTTAGGSYSSVWGTSFSAPYVAGVAALVLSVQDMDPLTLRQHLIDTADDIVDSASGAGSDRTYGKLINVERALSSLAGAPTPTPPVGTSPTPTPPSGCGLPGDIDCSGEVNIFDLSRLLGAYGTTDPAADIDGSGEVNILDLSILLTNFGK